MIRVFLAISAMLLGAFCLRPAAPTVTTSLDYFSSSWDSGSGTAYLNLTQNSGETPHDFSARIISTQRSAFSVSPADGTHWQAEWDTIGLAGCGTTHEVASREPGVPFETTIMSELTLTLANQPPNCP
jgi:hypothetical protein